jgi:hypothetical protein
MCIVLYKWSNQGCWGVPGVRSYGTRSLLKNIRARGRIIFLFFPHAARACALKIRQINSAILKVPDGAWIR